MLAHRRAESRSRGPQDCSPLTGGWSYVLCLVLDYWQGEVGLGVWLQNPGTSELVSGHCWVGWGEQVSWHVGYRVWGVLKHLLAFSWAGRGLSWSQNSIWTDWVPRMQDYRSLESGVYPLMGEAGSEPTAGFLEWRAGAQGFLRLVPSHWWVKLGPGTSGGQGCV